MKSYIKLLLVFLDTLENYYKAHYGRLPKKEELNDLPKRLQTLLDNILSVPRAVFK